MGALLVNIEALVPFVPNGRFRETESVLQLIDRSNRIYFQPVSQGLRQIRSLVQKGKATFEYLRALRYELRPLPAERRGGRELGHGRHHREAAGQLSRGGAREARCCLC